MALWCLNLGKSYLKHSVFCINNITNLDFQLYSFQIWRSVWQARKEKEQEEELKRQQVSALALGQPTATSIEVAR